jgi:hypothetical protein
MPQVDWPSIQASISKYAGKHQEAKNAGTVIWMTQAAAHACSAVRMACRPRGDPIFRVR